MATAQSLRRVRYWFPRVSGIRVEDTAHGGRDPIQLLPTGEQWPRSLSIILAICKLGIKITHLQVSCEIK